MSKEKRFEIKSTEGIVPSIQVIVDKETGVNYLYIVGGGLTVLVGEDGKPVVTK